MLDDRALRYAADLLGLRFLAYVSFVDPEELKARIDGGLNTLPDPNEQALVGALQCALQWVPVPTLDPPLAPDGGRPDGSPGDRMRRFGWVDMDRAQSYANIYRLEISGADLPAIPGGLDPAEQAIAWAALDYYAVTLIPTPRPDMPSGEHPIVSHARTEVFIDAVRADGSIAKVVEATDPIWTSGGLIGFGAPTEQRVMGTIIAAAEQRVRMFDESSPEAFMAACVDGLRAVRLLCQDAEAEVPALIGFSHVSLPEGTIIDGPRGGRLRPARDADLRVSGSSLATIVLETTHPLRLAIGPMPPDDARFRRGRMQASIDTEIFGLAGLLVTRHGPRKGLPRQTWIKVFDPLAPFSGSFQPEIPGLADMTLDPNQAEALVGWVQMLERNYDPAIRLAVRRCLSGCAERPKPEDAVVDLVVALESLFGSGGGELTLRISTALAWLLGADADEREAIQRDAKRAYSVRSKIVHGVEVTGEQQDEASGLAERLLLDALERLLTDRPELIADPDRSLRLILGR